MSSSSAGNCLRKRKKDKKKQKKRQRRHSSFCSFPGNKLARHTDQQSVLPGHEGGQGAPSPSTSGGEAMVRAGEGDLVGLSVALNRELSSAQGASESSVPMEVDPAVRLSLPGDSEFVSRLTYAEVVAGLWAIGQRTAPSCGLAGIVEAPLEWLAEVVEAPLFMQPSLRPIKLVWSG